MTRVAIRYMMEESALVTTTPFNILTMGVGTDGIYCEYADRTFGIRHQLQQLAVIVLVVQTHLRS